MSPKLPRRQALAGLAAIALASRGWARPRPRDGNRRLVLYFNEDNPRVAVALEKLRNAIRSAEGTRRYDVEVRHVVADPHRGPVEPIIRAALEAGPDALIAPSGVLALAARAATTRIPILFGSHQDPVAVGLVSSLEAPGANATGFTTHAPIVGKRLELLLACRPAARTIGVVIDRWWDPDPASARFEPVVRAFGLEPRFVRADDMAQLQAQLANGKGNGVDAWYVHGLAFDHPAAVARAINATGKPAVYTMGLVVKAGGLMSYQAVIEDPFATWAKLLGLVLDGNPPDRIPVESPRNFEMHVNETTAAQLGLTLPRALLVRATHLHR